MTNLLNVLVLVIIEVVLIDATILNAERNFYKNKLERNNKVNKKIWTRSRSNIDSFDKPNHEGTFLFRGSSVDDDTFQKDFTEDQTAPKVSAYIQREKRSSKKKLKSKTLHKNSGKKLPKDNLNADIKSLKSENSSHGIMSIIKPTSVFNEYPYEVASYMKHNETVENSTNVAHNGTDVSTLDDKSNNILLQVEPLTDIKLIPDEDTSNNATESNQDPLDLNDLDLDATIYNTTGTNTKRSMDTNTSENYIVKKLAFNEVLNKTDESVNSSKVSRDIFDKDFPVWKQDAPIPEPKNDNKYFHESHLMVMPKVTNSNEAKPVTEGGLVKVLSMLTKTFKKIMMQHDSINTAHTEVMDIKDKFKAEYEDIQIKFEDFNQKYNLLLQTNDKIKELESSLKTKDEAFAKKQKVFTDNLSEFENQQKKFLAQQRQFYNIQKLMLSQNEKINIKQNSIMKAQNDISLRQNLFSQTLKKFKLAQTENKHLKPITNYMAKITSPEPKPGLTDAVVTPSPFPSTTPTMKINLLTIPTIRKFKNNDKNLLNEKNIHSIDDIVYKYYFNNTYIDNLIKSRLMNGFSIIEGLGGKRNSKVKRLDSAGDDKTILLPVKINTKESEESSTKVLNRERRWVNHHSRRKGKEQYYKNIAQPKIEIKPETNKVINYDYDIGQYFENAYEKHTRSTKTTPKPVIPEKSQYDPYTNMAQNFCNEIGQNANEQTFKWCVEKSIRRLKAMDTSVAPMAAAARATAPMAAAPRAAAPTAAASRAAAPRVAVPMDAAPSSSIKYSIRNTSNQPRFIQNSKTYTVNPYMGSRNAPRHFTDAPQTTSVFMFFPDNEELESNLKDFDLNPDTTGNVYFEGSLHASDLPTITNSDGLSDFMPGLDSNSRMDVDPVALDLQEKRRLRVQRMNQHLMKQISRGRFRV